MEPCDQGFLSGVSDGVAATLLVGWSWLIPPRRWQFDARAVEPTTLIEIDADALRARFETYR